MNMDAISDSFSDMWNLLRKNHSQLLTEYSKVYVLIYTIILFLGGVVFIGVSTLAVGGTLAGLLGNVPLVLTLSIIGLLVYIGIVIGINALTGVVYSITEESTKNKKVNIFKKMKELLVPISKYTILLYCIALAVFSIPIYLVVSSIFSLSPIGFLLSGALVFPFLIIYFLVVFLIQFSMLELVLKKRNVLDSFKASVDKVRRNWFVVLAFDIAFVLIYMAVMTGFAVIQNMLGLFAIFSLLNIFAVLFLLAVFIVLAFIQTIVLVAITVPFQYFFWKRLK